MSSETFAWAKEQRCGDPVTKAILMEIANWAKPTGYCEFLSIRRLAEVIEVSERTVQRHIRRLESEDREEGGLGLIRRVSRHRDDGGQSANSFELVGYLAPEATQRPPRQSVTPRCQNVTAPRQIDGEPGDNRVTRLGDKNNIPPSPAVAGEAPAPNSDDLFGDGPPGDDAPAVEPAKAHRLPKGWQPCPIEELPPMARDLVRQWPAGAYEAVSECFRLHWLAETRAIGRKKDWRAAHAKWLINDHSRVIRDAKAGVSFAALAPKGATGATVAAAEPTPAKARENQWSQSMHAALRRDLGEAVWTSRFAPCAVLLDDGGDGIGVTVIAPSEFQRGYLEAQFAPAIGKAVRAVTGAPAGWARFEVERPVRAKEPAHA